MYCSLTAVIPWSLQQIIN